MIAPTAIPAFAPVERPPPFDGTAVGELVDGAEVPVGAAVLREFVGVGLTKSSTVTLKQGTCLVKSLDSTKTCRTLLELSHNGKGVWRVNTYDIRASKERLVVSVVLALILGPVLHLDGSNIASSLSLNAIELVALMSRIDISDIAGY